MPKKYRVSGGHAVFGNPPGSTFTAELDPDHERHLCSTGHIVVVPKSIPDENATARLSIRKEK